MCRQIYAAGARMTIVAPMVFGGDFFAGRMCNPLLSRELPSGKTLAPCERSRRNP
jgi:hypothetical protein